ncbi:hypothetical protein BC332_04008 [Capsicum chinense]|nr:hypothetical protein BC332_04008 [Capsicum chinense]
MDYSSVATGYLCVASDKIPGAIDSAVFMVPTHYLSVATGVEDNKHGEEESFKRDDPNANSPSVEETSCFGKYLDLPEDDNARFQMKMVYDLLRRSFKNKNLIEALKGKGLSKKHKQSLCLVWFVHNVLWAKDVNNNINLDLINLSEDLEAFNSYPWGYESFKMTVEYLLTLLMPKTVNLYGFPWAFMAWAFEVIPYLRQQVNYQEEVFCSRILRWLSAKTDKNAKFFDLFNPPKEAVEVTATAEEHNMTVDDPSNASKDEEKVEPVRLEEQKNYPFEGFNILDEAPKKLIQLINDYSEWIADGLLKHHPGRYCQQKPEVSRNVECLINIIKGFSIPAGLPWHLVDKVYIPINCSDEFRWVRTNWSTIEAYRDKMANPFDVQYVDGIGQQIIGSLDYGPFVAAYAEYLSDELQVPNDGLDAGLLRKRYAAILWKYGEAKAQKPYATDIKDPRRSKPNFIALDEEQLVHID